jgi:acyl phosphate:glycerol-3-phosphate acyltransferase
VSPAAAWLIGAIAVGYLCGSIPVGLIIGRRRGVDPRTTGSGNIGATNVSRALGKKIGALVLLLDALKGAAPTAVALLADLGAHGGPWLVPAVGLAAITGHCFPVWLALRGGKGVATALGVFLVLDPASTGLAALVFAVVYLPFRVVSLASMAAAMSYPAFMVMFGRPTQWVDLALVAALVIVVRHRANIRRLVHRSEVKT